MKHIFITILSIMIAMPVFAQTIYTDAGYLTYEDISRPRDVFPALGEWAEVVFVTKKSNPLQFDSNVDGRISHNNKIDPNHEELIPKRVSGIIYKEDEEGGNLFYYILLRTDKKYKGRILNVASPGYPSFSMPLSLVKKQRLTFRIYNPQDATDGTCFQEHWVKGNQYFGKYKYNAARDEYLLAAQCVEATAVQVDEAKKAAENCTAITAMKEKGNKLASEEKYEEATNIFERAYMMNQLDTYLYNRYNYCRRNQASLCTIYFQQAENLFREKDYETAKDLYQEVLNNGCDTQLDAQKRINECETLLRKRKNSERYIGVELGGKMVGLTYGAFRDKVAMYVSAKGTVNELAEIARSEFNVKDMAMAELSLGLSIPLLKRKTLNRLSSSIFRGVWLNLGAGTTAANKFEIDDDVLKDYESVIGSTILSQENVDKFINDESVKDKNYGSSDVMKVNFGFTANAEIGLTVKVYKFALRGTYVRRWGVNDTRKLINDIGESTFYVGIGYCW